MKSVPAVPAAPSLLACLLLAGLCTGCTVWLYDDDDDDDRPSPPPPYYDVWEDEPNDSHCCPDEIGTLFAGGQIVIGGRIQDDPDDPFDGFGFESGEPIEVNFLLEPVDHLADLDLCVWDPALGAFAFCFDSPSSVEVGHFLVSSSFDPFHLVVSSFDGDAEYRLTVWAEPPGFAALAASAAEPEEPKGTRPVPLELYGPRAVADATLEPAVLDRGRIFEIDPDTGEIRTREVLVREDGIYVGPSR